MKKRIFHLFFAIFSVFFLGFSLFSCEKENKLQNSNPPIDNNGEILVSYFSATNNTKGVAEKIAKATGGTLYQIVPSIPYTQEDLNYSNSNSRSSIEQNDPNSRPEINGSVENMESYKTVFLGYPIWWGEAPRIIYTFLESYDFSNKTIIPFCTSGSSPIGNSAKHLESLTKGATWLEGTRFSSNVSQEIIDDYVINLGLKKD